MRNAINAFVRAQRQLMNAFGCGGEYFIKPLVDSPWQITGEKDMPILSYERNETMHNAVIVWQDGNPSVYRAKGYVMVVAIDCVKIAFIFNAGREM